MKKDEGTVRIHSNNYRLVFTKRLFSKVIQLNRLKSIYTTCEEQKLGKNQKYDNKLFFSIITNTIIATIIPVNIPKESIITSLILALLPGIKN